MSPSTSYEARHRRVRQARGDASGYPCARECGRQAAHWATIHGRDGLNPQEDYLPLCMLCHSAYDDHSGVMRRRAAEIRARSSLCYEVAMPPEVVQPNVPLHIQVAEIYKRRIAAGEYAPGDRLPTVRQMANLHHVSPGTAARVIELLAGEQLVRTRGRAGTVVAEPEVLPPRLVLGPQQMMRFAEPTPGQRTEVRAAGMVRLPQDGPERLVPILGLEQVPHYDWWNVYRREQVTTLPGGVPRLEVSWLAPEWAGRISALADQSEPVMPLGGVAALIAEHSGDPVAKGWHGVEARPALDDGREVPLFGAVVLLAAVYWWVSASGVVTEYGEYCLPQHRVIEHSYDVAM